MHDMTKSQKLASVHSTKHSQVIEIGLNVVDFSQGHFLSRYALSS